MDDIVRWPRCPSYVAIIPTVGFQLMEINCKTERENEMNCQAWSMAIY